MRRLMCLAAVVPAILASLGCESKDTPSPPPAAAPPATNHPPPALRVATPIPAPDDVAKPPADAETDPSGLRSKVLRAGTGKEHPVPGDLFDLEYVGWQADGKMFDRSTGPLQMTLAQVIPGWADGLQLMVDGEKRRLWIPAALAYGAHPAPYQPAGDLTVDVELSKLEKKSARVDLPPAPPDVAAPPRDAKTTASGLAYRELKAGHGKVTDPHGIVVVNYSGWTANGKPFESTLTRGRPSTMHIDRLIPGWAEGMRLMSEGEQIRLWIPAKLAYGDAPGRPGLPAGALVFDVELVSVK